MRSFFLLASLVACGFAQRLRIQEPVAGATITAGSSFVVELEDDEAATPVTQGTVIIALTECFNVCDKPDQWSASQVIYNGPLNVQGNLSAPQKGHYEDFTFDMPQYQPGGVVLSVAHLFDAELADATFVPLFEYTNILIHAGN